jgi:hypothetical protein
MRIGVVRLEDEYLVTGHVGVVVPTMRLAVAIARRVVSDLTQAFQGNGPNGHLIGGLDRASVADRQRDVLGRR